MTRLFGIIGDPVAQVRSPMVFNALFQERGVDAVMVPMHVTAEGLESALAGLRSIENLSGIVITVPHKQAAAKLATSASDRVRVAGAANALRPVAGGWEAELFDGEGFAVGLESKGFSIAGKRCSIVGAGGAGAAIALALVQRHAASVSVWDVDRARAENLVSRLAEISTVRIVVGWPDDQADIAINATPLGMRPEDPLPITLASLKKGALVADAIMKPTVTPLLKAAARLGHATQEGRHMLDHQVESIWTFFGL